MAAQDSTAGLITAVVCPPQWSIPPERLLNLEPAELYVVQDDLSRVWPGLLASLEWAATHLGVKVVVLFDGHAVRDELAIQMAPYGMKVVNGVVGPNEVVRFEPPLRSVRPARMWRSRSKL